MTPIASYRAKQQGFPVISLIAFDKKHLLLDKLLFSPAILGEKSAGRLARLLVR
jgi:hypothetical protein